MPVPDNAYSALTNIRIKIRRLTRSPSNLQLSDADIDNYINTFLLYDVPEHLRQFSLRTVLTFWTQPYIDTYSTNTTDQTNPLYNFKNKYTTVHPPVYIAGYNTFFSQSREQFYGVYPSVNFISQVGAGDGVTTTFTGNVNPPGPLPLSNVTTQQTVLLRNNVLFDSVAVNGNGLTLVDIPTGPLIGNLVVPNTISPVLGTINYATGAFTINFPSAPAPGQPVNSQTVPQIMSRPLALLFYQDQFIVRPIPDQPYRIDIEAYIRPTQLLASDQDPEIAQWWQYIAYGAAKKIFEDRMDPDSVQQIMPEFKKQELLVLRKTIVQYTNERTATIYTEQTASGLGGNGWGWGGGLF